MKKEKKQQPLTDWIMNNGYGQAKGGYIDVANERGTDDKQVLQILREKKEELLEYDELYWLKELYDREEVFLSEEEKRKPNQKWHLLISYYAYKLIVKRYGIESKVVEIDDIEKKVATVLGGLSCPELCLWMVEAAMDGKYITADEVKELSERIIEFKTEGKGQWRSFRWWKENVEKYSEKVKAVISGGGEEDKTQAE